MGPCYASVFGGHCCGSYVSFLGPGAALWGLGTWSSATSVLGPCVSLSLTARGVWEVRFSAPQAPQGGKAREPEWDQGACCSQNAVARVW